MAPLSSRMRSVLSSVNAADVAAWLVFVLISILTYRRLFLFDRNLHAPSDIQASEEIFFSTSGVSPLFVYCLAGWFIARRVARLSSDSVELKASIVGAAGMTAAMGLVVWGHLTSATEVLPPSFAIFLLSVGLLLGGFAGGRIFFLPSVFVALLGTPIPTPFMNYVIYIMQLWTAEVSVGVVRLVGYSAQQAGDLVITPWAIFQVIESCAGLGMVQTLVMTAFVYGEAVGLSTKRRVIMIMIAPLIGLIVNFGRVLLLVLGRSPESQPEHSLQGIVMIVVGVLLLWGLDELLDLRRVGPGRVDLGIGAIDRREPKGSDSVSNGRIYALSVVVALIGISTISIEPWRLLSSGTRSVHSIPREIADWKMNPELLDVDTTYLGSVRFSSRTWRRYDRGEESVTLFAGMNDRELRFNGLISGKTKTLQSGSVVLETLGPALEPKSSGATDLIVRNKRGEKVLVRHWYENTRGLWVEIFRSAFALDRGLGRRGRPSLVVRIATPLDNATGNLERARRRLQEFSDLIRVEIEQLDESR